MFQRRQDQQILRILQRMPTRAAAELTTPSLLASKAVASDCPHIHTLHGLIADCDLGKDPDSGEGVCGRMPGQTCHLKHHTVWMKRYGHFGKVPTSLALLLRETGDEHLGNLYARVLASEHSALGRAKRLEAELSRAWRVNQKISAMYLSMLANPDLSPGCAPWSEGIDWTYYVVIDSNVDLFLQAIGYPGPWTYSARRAFVARLADRIDLAELRPGLQSMNPRLVQQAMYLFMSISNRRAAAPDCVGTGRCASCSRELATLCPMRRE